ncbi:hypothetical protein niasHS_015254 [Heterodera schachtii]|uniref:Uncharacterized protein n=1 Tax=Heterodera schachtii TaxID=97005 RepID=A0ABD2I2V9_HETSC
MSSPSLSVFCSPSSQFSVCYPCCPGSQKVVSLMANYVGTFAHSFSKSSLCSNAKSVAGALKGQLIGCSKGGDATLLADIEASLATHSSGIDGLMDQIHCQIIQLNLGFVRAMFAIAAAASSHASNNNEWHALSAQFGQQISEIDSKCAEFGIVIAKVPFDGPKGDHSQRNVPGTDNVISMPGLTGSHKQ